MLYCLIDFLLQHSTSVKEFVYFLDLIFSVQWEITFTKYIDRNKSFNPARLLCSEADDILLVRYISLVCYFALLTIELALNILMQHFLPSEKNNMRFLEKDCVFTDTAEVLIFLLSSFQKKFQVGYWSRRDVLFWNFFTRVTSRIHSVIFVGTGKKK